MLEIFWGFAPDPRRGSALGPKQAGWKPLQLLAGAFSEPLPIDSPQPKSWSRQ